MNDALILYCVVPPVTVEVVSVIDLSVGNRLFAELANQKSEFVNEQLYPFPLDRYPYLIFKSSPVGNRFQGGLALQVARSL